MKTIKNRKRVVNTAALGLSLLMSSTLLVGNAVSVYASPTISTTEQNAIDAFLTTQPVDGDTRNIATTNPAPVAPITYTFEALIVMYRYSENQMIHYNFRMIIFLVMIQLVLTDILRYR